MSRLLEMQNRFYDTLRSKSAYRAGKEAPEGETFDSLRGHKYALLVTFKRNGDPVPTPVWFGLDDKGRAYVHTGSEGAKVRRIRNNPRVRVAPCTVRGKPLGPPTEGTARLVPAAEEGHAEAAIQGNYGLGRRLYERGFGGDRVESLYLEVVPGARD